jgi:hypothetical protein
MSLARMASAEAERSTTLAVSMMRSAPPVPLALEWQPPAAQVAVPPDGVAMAWTSSGSMHFW